MIRLDLGAQYEQFEPVPGVKIKGALTMGENIADLGGVEMAYAAYRRYVGRTGEPAVLDSLSGDQRFFRAYGQAWRSKMREGRLREILLSDPHSPPEFRVNGVVRMSTRGTGSSTSSGRQVATPSGTARPDLVETDDTMQSPDVAAGVLETIGHTPVVRLQRLAPPPSADVFVKLEYFNPTGSCKDRMALAMIQGAEACGALRPGMRVVEYTGGSTGSSLAMVCAVKGYAFRAALVRCVRARENSDDAGIRR